MVFLKLLIFPSFYYFTVQDLYDQGLTTVLIFQSDYLTVFYWSILGNTFFPVLFVMSFPSKRIKLSLLPYCSIEYYENAWKSVDHGSIPPVYNRKNNTRRRKRFREPEIQHPYTKTESCWQESNGNGTTVLPNDF